MLFSLDVIRARKGDCLMLHYGSKKDPHLIMIDGGPKSVYTPHLKPRIGQIRKARKLDDRSALLVDLLMVSHVDDDHIQGILDLTRELITAKMERTPSIVRVLGFWHNSFDDVIGNTPKELTAAFTTQFGAASMGGDPPDLDLEVEDEDPETVVSSLKVLASIQQGAQLRSDIVNNLRAPLNPQFKNKLILAKTKGKAVPISNGLKFTVVGPLVPELEKLQKKHDDWLKELAEGGKTPEDVLAAYVDKSVPNLSSIVVMAEFNKKQILLTGDARGDKILEGLELTGLLKAGGKIKIDVLKVPHHGSSNNLDNDFFERIIADHYVFSGDGEHGNPERETLEMLLAARGEDDDYEIHLTYPVDEIDVGRKEDWLKEQNKEKTKKEKNPKQKIRANWSPKKQSLTALFAENKKFAKKVRSGQEGVPHVINLLDELED